MATTHETNLLADELTDFLASAPSREAIIEYHPSKKTQKRALRLLQKNRDGTITRDEQWELDQFEYIESLMRLVKAKARSRRANSNG